MYAGGIWKGDVLVADLEELETMDASEIFSKRLNAKESIPNTRPHPHFSCFEHSSTFRLFVFSRCVHLITFPTHFISEFFLQFSFFTTYDT